MQRIRIDDGFDHRLDRVLPCGFLTGAYGVRVPTWFCQIIAAAIGGTVLVQLLLLIHPVVVNPERLIFPRKNVAGLERIWYVLPCV